MKDAILALACGCIVGAPFVVAACSGAQPVTESATCSPKADIWHQAELARVCGKKLTTECPEAPGLRARYLELEAEECSSKP